MAFRIVLMVALSLSHVTGTLSEERPSEASLKLAREIVAYYKGQNNKQFFPYYPLDPYQQQQQQQQPQHQRPYSKLIEGSLKDKQDNLEPMPRFMEGSLDPWTIEDDSMTMQSTFVNEDLNRFTEDQMMDKDVNNLNRAIPQCGTSFQDRIVGGDETQRGEFPWTVALEMSWGFQFCGGALINEKFVLTASHCLSWGRDVLKTRVLIGGHNLDVSNEAGSVYRNVKKIKLHIKYNSTTTDFDVALIELDKPVKLGGPIRTICLPDGDLAVGDLVGEEVVAAGWGKMSSNGQSSNILRSVKIKVISNDVCKYLYAPNEITAQMMCAGDPKGGKDSCQGDSGGPLMKKNGNNQWTQVGIVSFGIGCGQSKYPGVYSRLSVLVDWINRHSRII